MLSRAELLEIFRENPKKSLSSRELAVHLALEVAERRGLRRLLKKLCDEGALARRGGNAYALAVERTEVLGIISFRANGNAELASDDGQVVTVLPRHLGGALPGDRVRAELLPAKDGVRRAAEVREVTAHGPGQILGVFRSAGRGGYLEPREPELFPYHLAIPRAEARGAEDGDLIVAVLDEPPRGRPRLQGRVLEVLGHPSDPTVEIAAIAYHHGLSIEFPEDVLDEVDEIPMEVTAAEREGRLDLREVPFVTIDGADAKDFDDAVYVEPRSDGGFLVRVAIADVSHYVREGSALDREAVSRGTSVYFPDRVLPMLPHPLSNGICSLKPDVERLALCATLWLDAEARTTRSEFHEVVIRSHARLTYDEVWEHIQKRRPLRGAGDPSTLMAVCERLNARRRTRGSIDFDIAEAKVVVDQDGEVVDVVRRERNLAHRIVEELMLAANEAVAAHFERLDHPTVYRVHDQPDEEKLAAFAKLASSLGFRLRRADLDDPRALARFVESLGEEPGARALHALLLRSMKQAVYDVENIGHYGLAATEYLHFTSPIRRYPDLLVHRLLRALLRSKAHERAGRRGSEGRDELVSHLAEVSAQASLRERESMDAERETMAYYRARLMQGHVGEEFPGRIAGVAPFGLFVEIEKPFVDGLVHVQTLDDFYEYVEEQQRLVGRGTGRALCLGDAVWVRVDAVNVQRRQISLSLVPGPEGASRGPRRGRAEERREAGEPRDGSRPPRRRGAAEAEENLAAEARPRHPAPRRDDRGAPTPATPRSAYEQLVARRKGADKGARKGAGAAPGRAGPGGAGSRTPPRGAQGGRGGKPPRGRR